MNAFLPNLAVTAGDPAGIGAEIVARLFAGSPPTASRAVLVGAPGAFGAWLKRAGLSAPVLGDPALLDPDGGGESLPAVVILDTGVRDSFVVGENSAGGGKHAGRAIEMACELASSGRVAGIVTAPISKKSLNLANFHYPGHTEMLARYLNSPQCQMVMVHGALRVVPLTRHLPLREVADAITREAIETCVKATRRGLIATFGVRNPRMAVAGLNPHAGDGGVLGDEEERVIKPALAALRGVGIEVDGPFAADAMFQRAAESVLGTGGAAGAAPFDAYIAMYHDQGLVAFKALARRRGVNVTVGLPVIRTSPDHGTAYDIAGKGLADPGSMREAYELAEMLCGVRTGGGRGNDTNNHSGHAAGNADGASQ